MLILFVDELIIIAIHRLFNIKINYNEQTNAQRPPTLEGKQVPRAPQKIEESEIALMKDFFDNTNNNTNSNTDSNTNISNKETTEII